MEGLHRFQDELADFLGHAWLGGGQGFDPRDRIARDNAAVGDSVRRKRMPALGSETEHVARQQHIDDLASAIRDRKSTRLNSSHQIISYAVFCLKKKKKKHYYT